MKNFNELSKMAYNNKADYYNETIDGKFTLKFKRLLCENIVVKDHSKILDIACGNGTLLKMLSQENTFNGYGIDISDKMIKNASKICSEMVFKVAGCEKIPFEAGFFDVITVCAAYHHFPDTKAFAKELSRVIKNHGFIYIADIYLPTPLRVIINPFVPLSKEGDVKFYSPQEIMNNLQVHGFRQIRIIKKGYIQMICMQKYM
ncbi:class I SAM-dependent methyltransferase [Tindallia californiensis]|uniref:Methyltransferase domain-containing protein n=1 Tax=Tindallia californiensis TaxID=159292 RepID=A0A1H3PRC4_9FIRM|nr:class I SAM-dependent methyltransferase [Tindallia californiensis]SDZ03596.1 Methyltransferase domain-containing protein [Tindallia californiensis]